MVAVNSTLQNKGEHEILLPRSQLHRESVQIHQGIKDASEIKNKWEGAKWGQISHYVFHTDPTADINEETHEKLDALRATSIAGNDITGSCLYSSGLVLQIAGRMGIVCLLSVSFVLYLFRIIYAEVGSALPLNGGTYNAMLNTVSKKLASLAACLTILSYTATAVVSASSAANYIDYLTESGATMYISIGILGFFALLTILGIQDSANVATFIFLTHLLTLTVTAVAALLYIAKDKGELLLENLLFGSSAASPHSNAGLDFFYGFGAALLGISGFESSANYIEEQAIGVFPKTLRNMWVAVSIFNPLLGFLSLGVVRLVEVQDDAFANTLLAHVCFRSGGRVLRIILVVDAVLVLAAGVLTSFVGVVGLVRRMALDRCLPSFLLITNRWRKSNHFIVLSFLLVTSSLRLMTSDMTTLGGVFALAFLCVMFLFSVSNILLKYRRKKLPRSPIASYPHAMFAASCTLLGIVSNIMASQETVKYFIAYAASTILLVVFMFARVQVLRIFLGMFQGKLPISIRTRLEKLVLDIRSVPLIFFAKESTISLLNKAVLYTLETEDTNTIMVVHVYTDETDTLKEFEHGVQILDRLYPKLTINLVLIRGEFTPELVDQISHEFDVPKNYMFVSCPGHKFPHSVGSLGGVRVIMHN